MRRRCRGDIREIDLTDLGTIDNFVTLLCKGPVPGGHDEAETEAFQVHDNGFPMYWLDLRVTCLSLGSGRIAELSDGLQYASLGIAGLALSSPAGVIRLD